MDHSDEEDRPNRAPGQVVDQGGGTRTVLVTGGTGTLGRHLVRQLRAAGHDTRVLSHSGAADTIPGDLTTGAGLAAALAGADTVVHCASTPNRPRAVDIAGTKHLLGAAGKAGVRHLIYPSIVGVERNQGFPLYRAKLVAEQLIAGGGVPWTILRATQFHELMRVLLGGLDRVPVLLPVPAGIRVQPVASTEVAARIVELVAGPPSGRVTELGGPQVRTLRGLADAYLEHVGHGKRAVEIPIPGSVARAFRAGAQLSHGGDLGRMSWEQFLSSG